MKIAVMGAGAVGCYYGALLAKAGHDLTLVARPLHVEAIAKHGLVLETAAGREMIALGATSEPSGVAGAELVLFCVKSMDTEVAGAQILPHLADGATVWSLQNGVDNAERLEVVLCRPVVPAVVYVAAGMAGPGHVLHRGRGDLIVRPAEKSETYAAAFAAAGIPVKVSEDVIQALWSKLVINCALNALSAIPQLPYGVLGDVPGTQKVISDLVDECLAVGHAAGIVLPEEIRGDVGDIIAAMPKQLSSTAQDVARGKPSEIDHLNGYIVKKGESLGVPTPANRALHVLVKLIERKAG